ncbi:hypothetical protein ACHAW5_008210 [Stephanodiscus triporus]|uniref:Uncharacterized protein n=1 Tax=Stephanodiscus triporus TaxID=2934178 RepID=A0ABD3NC52_9STRA
MTRRGNLGATAAAMTTTTMFLSPPGSVPGRRGRPPTRRATSSAGSSASGDDVDVGRDGRMRFPALPCRCPRRRRQAAAALLRRAYSSDVPVSKSVLLSYSSMLVNRDNGLFDNLPWSTWSVDPELNERDGAGNVVIGRYATGKRAAYQRLMGKDWRGRSLSLGNMANKLRFLLGGECDDLGGGRGGPASSSSSSLSSSVDRLEDDGTAGGTLSAREGGREGGGEDYDYFYDDNDNDSTMMLSLARRLLRLETREAEMEVAESEQHLAIVIAASRSSKGGGGGVDDDDVVVAAAARLEAARNRLRMAESSLRAVDGEAETRSSGGGEGAPTFFPFAFPWDDSKKEEDEKRRRRGKKEKARSLLSSILDKLSEQNNPPPYRGAIGYPAMLDTREEMFELSALPYSSPYELLLDIIEEQLNSKVVGCVLEPASLLEGNLVLGGAILLERMGVPKRTTLLGEAISYTDDDDVLGNKGVLPRSMYVVKCFSDEAVGMAMASGMPVLVEEGIYNRAGGIPVELDLEAASSVKAENRTLSVTNRVPPVRILDDSYFPQMEGERVASERASNLVRIPLTTNPGLFDGPNQASASSSASRSTFSTFNPVRSLAEYDALTDDAKVRLLLKLESFTGILPRPRAVRSSLKFTSQNDGDGLPPPSILDEILLPLIDESVRRQYRIRDAERRKDFEEANALRALASPRQLVLERAQRAREDGLDDEAIRMEEDAELYRSLRADATQDESAYDRYLDRDEWYERETRARIKRLDKSKFGTLLDGVDLP